MFDFNQDIPIGSDHAGFSLKAYIIQNLSFAGYHFKDFGTFSEESVDYPDFIHPVARAINDGIYKMGIIICGSLQFAGRMKLPDYPAYIIMQTLSPFRHVLFLPKKH